MLGALASMCGPLLASATTQATTQETVHWFVKLFTTDSVAHAVLLLGIVAALGLALGSIKIWGIRLGIGGVLFSGILVGHIYAQYGLGTMNEHVLEFTREFGLILFVYTIGMQVGPGFVSSLRRSGLPLNIMAASIVTLGAVIAVLLHYVGQIPIPAAVGLFSGATTNTPSLAAAQEALKGFPDLPANVRAYPVLGYAVAYPFGILGIILTMLLIRFVFRVDLGHEAQLIAALHEKNRVPLQNLNLEIKNPNLDGLQVRQIPGIRETGVVISRILQGEKVVVARPNTMVKLGNVLHAVGTRDGLEQFQRIVGAESGIDLRSVPSDINYRRLIVTKPQALGKTIDELNLHERFHVTVTRVGRGEVEMSPHAAEELRYGDTVRVVGEAEAIKAAAAELGDSARKLDHPHVIPIFVGIVLGVILGSWEFSFGNFPAPVKLGLAGGPLVVAILLSRLGNLGPLVWYMPASANFMVRELGIVLFLACVGLKSGDKFLNTLLQGDGFYWMACAAIITMGPLLIVGFIGRLFYKVNYMTLCGVLAGSMTDPPALAFAGQVTGSDAPSVSYATVYPLTMLLRVLYAQIIVLMFMAR